jgi:hypothetical protein
MENGDQTINNEFKFGFQGKKIGISLISRTNLDELLEFTNLNFWVIFGDASLPDFNHML